MEALKNEIIIKEFNNKKIKLTNYRVRMYTSRNEYQSIMLDKINYISVRYYENSRYLHLSIIFLIGFIVSLYYKSILNYIFQIEYLLVISLLFYLGYLFKREKVVNINSFGEKTKSFSVTGIKTNEIDDFIQEVEKQSFKLKGIINS